MPKKMNKAKPVGAKAGKPKASSHKRGYGNLYRKLRALRLYEHPVCERCNNCFSCVTHHLKYGEITIDDLVALCHRCHADEEFNKRNS